MSDAHHITITPAAGRVKVTLGGKVVVDSTHALSLKEGAMAPVIYVPREDADMSLLKRTAHSTHCPYKGDASYYTIEAGGKTAENAVWTYETPKAGVEQIANHLAFYPSRVDAIEVS
jgi:uncharacterized protein (DUF427 family)